MKIRVLTATNKKKLVTVAEHLATLAENGIYKADIIPPAYSCDNERLIIIVVTPSAIPNKADYERFIQGLNRQRSRNVAFIVDGDPAEIQSTVDTIKENTVNVVDNVLVMDGGLPSLLSAFSKLKPEEKEKATEWFNDVLTKLA